jgi:HEAT repeat protein
MGGENKTNSQKQDQRIASLILDLASEDGLKRQDARSELEAIGEPAIPHLVEAFKNGKHLERWEAVKALVKFGDPITTKLFVEALQDDDFEIRWSAAEGLASIGYPALKEVLESLITNIESVRLRNGAHYFLRRLSSTGHLEKVKPVLAALDSLDFELEAPLAAEKLIEQL